MTKPVMCMLEGISASGKSTLAKHIHFESLRVYVTDENVEDDNIAIHSTDDLREELFGNVDEQGKNDELYHELHARICKDLQAGKNTIYDATNLNKKRRIAFLQSLEGIECHKVCVMIFAAVQQCIEFNRNRKHMVPDEVICKQYRNWQPAHYSEGFDAVYMAVAQLSSDGRKQKFQLKALFEHADDIQCRNDDQSDNSSGEYIDKNKSCYIITDVKEYPF